MSVLSNVTISKQILRLPAVEIKTGYKRSHIYKLMKEGKFPKARRIGKRTVGWSVAEIDAWIDSHFSQEAK